MEDINAIAKILTEIRKCTKLAEISQYLHDRGGTTIRLEGDRILSIDADNFDIAGKLYHVRVFCIRLPHSGDAEILVREFATIEKFDTPDGAITKESLYSI